MFFGSIEMECCHQIDYTIKLECKLHDYRQGIYLKNLTLGAAKVFLRVLGTFRTSKDQINYLPF